MNFSPDMLIAVAGSLASALGAYYGAIMAIRVEIARLDERIRALEKAQDSDHAKLDELARSFHNSRV